MLLPSNHSENRHSTRSCCSLIAFGFLALMPACGDEAEAGTNDDILSADACNSLAQDSASLGGGEPVSFAESVMPVFGLSCNAASCHMGIGGGTFPGFGPKCVYDPNTDQCFFDPGMLSPEVLDTVYATLRAQSAAAPNLSRVEPGDVLRSFLVLKISACEDAFPETTGCTSCGTEMPPDYPLRVSSPKRYELLLRWVAQGALR